MRIDILCSGSKGNCTLIRTASTTIMLDCGASSKKYIVQRMEEAGCHLEDLQAVLITHTHSDHIKQLRHFAWLPVYAYAPIVLKDPKKQIVELALHPIRPLEPFQIGDIRLMAIALSHDAGPTCGFIAEAEGEKLVYITDTGYVQHEIEPLLKDANYYVLESNHDVDMLMHTNRTWSLKQRILSSTGHLCNQDCSHLLMRLITPRTRHVVLAHLSQEANTPQLALEAFQQAAADRLPSDYWFELHTASQNALLSFGGLQRSSLCDSSGTVPPKRKQNSLAGPAGNSNLANPVLQK